MAKSRITISIFLLRIIYRGICGLVNLTSSSKRLIRIKVAVGTLILSLSTSLAFSQEKSNIPSSINAKNDTIKLNITLEEELTPLEDIVVMCYYGGPPSYKEPMFWGGEKALQEFISNELVYPQKAIKKKVEGIVELSYTIDMNGKVKDVVVINGIGNGCDEEAQRIVEALPSFSKGFKDRKPAEFEKMIQVAFKLPKE